MKNPFYTLALSIFISSIACADILRAPSEFASIQAAIDIAAENDTVLVSEGLFTENIIIGQSLVLSSDYVLLRVQPILNKPSLMVIPMAL